MMQLIGYQGVLSQKGIHVKREDAYTYAMEQIKADKELEAEFKQATEEWFFSGDFVKIYDGV